MFERVNRRFGQLQQLALREDGRAANVTEIIPDQVYVIASSGDRIEPGLFQGKLSSL